MTTNVPEPQSDRDQRWLLPVIGVLVVTIVVLLAILFTSGSSSTPAPVAAAAPTTPSAAPTSTSPPGEAPTEGARKGTEIDLVRRAAGDPLALGRIDAPVVLVWWADLRCPFCAMFAEQTLPTLIKDYVDTGKVRIEVHDVGYFGPQSVDTAVAARAAGKQGKFFDYLEAVYAAAPHQGHPDMPARKLIRFAKQVGVPDLAEFKKDMKGGSLRKAVLVSTAEAQQFGISSVPFFVAGRSSLRGAQPTEVFQQFVDAALAKAP